ncbi:hypothetical protein M407DRAFT_75106 [Tulasnella calospora MUT 4182]|uniref:Metallo-beta-lactamase domain-containing protein n=1 Tax=Tulasnella calospora MUT 4182 TaxID=1051891 RepID=A0A0C3QIR9_9AGAM|nr:hypothetical protein M407DRAFT_75106 [Tulasnella calospora MUT 4182]
MSIVPSIYLKAVDKVEITFLVDNSVERMTRLPPGFLHEVHSHLFHPSAPVDEETGCKILDLENYCCGAHGFSVLIKTKIGDETHTTLFDTGPESKSIARNIASLNVDTSPIETVVLSHWHADHSGGILELLRIRQSQAAEKTGPAASSPANNTIAVDLHPSRPDARGIAVPPPTYDKVICRLPPDPTFQEIRDLGAEVSLHDEPHTVAGGQVFVSGEIPRVVKWEEGLFGAVRWVGKNDEREESGQGTTGKPATGDGKWVKEDHIMDERYAAIDVKGKGLIVFSACSHAGICNVITDAVKSLNRPIYMIIGGLHLAPPDQVYRIAPTVEFISKSLRPAPTYILPMHCTGFKAKIALEQELGEGCVPAGVGMKVSSVFLRLE